MRVFILGATGWIGGAITDAFLQSHHQVLGLARTLSAVSALEAKGATPIPGDMDAYENWLPLTQQADAVIVASSASLQSTVQLLQALVKTMQNTHKPLVYISGSSLYGDFGKQKQVNEEVFIQRLTTSALQRSAERVVYRAQEDGIHGMVIVGAGILYGRNGGATPSFWLEDARQLQAAWYTGEGRQRWSTVHVEDLARLTVLATEQLPSFRVLNAVADALPLREAAELIAQATQQNTLPEDALHMLRTKRFVF